MCIPGGASNWKKNSKVHSDVPHVSSDEKSKGFWLVKILRSPEKFISFVRVLIMKRRPTIYRSNNDKRKKESKSRSKESTRTIKLKSETRVKYPSNRIITSKYTIWNFLPKNLFEQFRRIANFYFFCMAIISLIIESPVSPVTSIVPLFFVIMVSAVKQGYEDFLRHMADREVNDSPVAVIRKGCIQTIPSKQIKVGDLVRVECDQDIPCDLVLLLSSHSESKCFVTTANLDGETNLKVLIRLLLRMHKITFKTRQLSLPAASETLHCPRSLKRTCRKEADLLALEATIKCENPTPHLYKFHGRIEFGARTSSHLRHSALIRQQSVCSMGNSQMDLELKNMTTRFPDVSQNQNENQSPPLDLSKSPVAKRKRSAAKRTESFPKSAIKTHKKTFSNVERVSFNLEKGPEPEPKVQEWSFEAKAFMLCKRNPSLLTNFNRMSLRSSDGNVADPLSAENLLLRGSKLKNTNFVYGCAVYTGAETKLALNSKLTSNKFSTVEKSINKYLLFYLGILIVKVIVSTVFKVLKESKIGYEFRTRYLSLDDLYEVTFASVLEDLFSFVTLYNYVIPISLYVTIELQKFLGTLFFEWDLRMYDETSDETAICNTSDLNEDLGQIEYLFTDKTGTLTKNEMQFERCSINGIIYEEKNGRLYPLLQEARKSDEESPIDLEHCSREIELFLSALTLCHTVQVSGGGEIYNATSPDEKALIEAMKRLDIVFQDDDDEVIVIRILGQCKFFKKLEVLEFSSERKRMSVIIQDEEENIILYCKGAETSVIPQVKDGPKDLTLKHVADFATQRLRTLVVGYKFISKDEYEKISEKLKVARQTLSSEREAIVANTYKRIESNLTVLGATGIRDDIQEEVKETLKSLRAAGIKIWMLTGDKLETAENISLECHHFEEYFIRLILTQQKNPDACEEILKQYLVKIEENTESEFGLTVDGESLTTALTYHRDLFRNLCVKCAAVICSRMSPLQKKEVVRLIKDQKQSPITAAIGDGANDVSMIQEAHVGIGIMGKEGRQAVRCSDFAFAKFKFLRRALLLHGHWYYVRVATLVQYFFYKNIAFVLPQFYFLFFSGYSIQSLYDSFYLTCFNAIFTSIPVLIYGLIEQDYTETQLENSPELYLIHKRNKLMAWGNFLCWFALGMWHSVVIFFLPTFLFFINSSVMTGARNIYLEAYGTIIFHSSVTVVTLKLLLHSRFWSAIFIGSILFSGIALVVPSLIYSFIFIEKLTSSNFWVYVNLLGSPTFWLIIILICTVSLIPDFIIYAYLDKNRYRIKSSQC